MATAPNCPFCNPALASLAQSPRWRLLRHADPVPIAGWMMLAARAHRTGVDELAPDEAAELGPALAALAAAVRAVTGCERTYVITFNEATPHLHLHVIPRHAADPSTTSWALADRYRAMRHDPACIAPAAIAERMATGIVERAMSELAPLGFRAG